MITAAEAVEIYKEVKTKKTTFEMGLIGMKIRACATDGKREYRHEDHISEDVRAELKSLGYSVSKEHWSQMDGYIVYIKW